MYINRIVVRLKNQNLLKASKTYLLKYSSSKRKAGCIRCTKEIEILKNSSKMTKSIAALKRKKE
jgi:uncharacterized protein YdeI (YjbR/CyaY-like superfamily)